MSESFEAVLLQYDFSYDTLRCWMKRVKGLMIGKVTEEYKIELIKEYDEYRKKPNLKQSLHKEGVNYDAFRWWLYHHKGLMMGDLNGLPFDRYYMPYIEEYKEFKNDKIK